MNKKGAEGGGVQSSTDMSAKKSSFFWRPPQVLLYIFCKFFLYAFLAELEYVTVKGQIMEGT